MEIIKAFNENNLHTEITIKGTHDDPLFRSSDIGLILDIATINTSIKDFDETEKVMVPTKTLGGIQQVSFLTEKGLYNILFISRKPIAKKFKNWVCDVIKEIRLKSKYELEKKLEEQQELLLEKEANLLEQQELISNSHQKIEELESINKNLLDESYNLKMKDKTSVIYAYNVDTRHPIPELKIGCSQNYYDRIKPYKQTNKFAKLEFVVEIPEYINLKLFEHYIHNLLIKYRIEGEVFKIDVPTAKGIILNLLNIYKLLQIPQISERQLKITKINYSSNNILNDILENLDGKTYTYEISTQTDTDELLPIISSPFVQINNLYENFDKYISETCIVRSDVEVSSTDIVGQYRIWTKSASKEIFHAFQEYMKTKFIPARLKVQDKNQVVNGFKGVTLKEIIYKKTLNVTYQDEENFIFHSCKFYPSGKVLFSALYEEYQKWKKSIGKDVTSDDEKRLKNYLKSSEHTLYTTLWTPNGNGQGFYGLSLKSDVNDIKKTSSTGKTVEKRNIETNDLLGTWQTIAKAAVDEKIAPSKMSRCIKNKFVFNDDYYYCIC
jgi:prophage antirepressor-like protein